MDAPNSLNHFSAITSAYFLGMDWSINLVNNFVTFRGMGYTILTFTSYLVTPQVLNEPIVVTFFMPHVVHINPLINLFPPP